MLNTPQTNSAQDAGQAEKMIWFGWNEEWNCYQIDLKLKDGSEYSRYHPLAFHPQVLAMQDIGFVDDCIQIQRAQQTV